MDGQYPNLGDLMKTLLLNNLRTCSGCRRPNVPSNPDFGDWVVQRILTIPYAAKCPDCQSPEDRAECAIRQASGIDYRFEGFQLVEDPKSTDDDDGHGSQKAS